MKDKDFQLLQGLTNLKSNPPGPPKILPNGIWNGHKAEDLLSRATVAHKKGHS